MNKSQKLYSASNLIGFMGCRHNAFLEFFPPKTDIEKVGFDEQAKLVQEKGLEHEKNYLGVLRDSGLSIAEIPNSASLEEKVSLTSEAMHKGADIIYQAALLNSQWHGFADFLEKVESPSKFGSLNTQYFANLPIRVIIMF